MSEEWGVCQTCGQDVKAKNLVLHPRWGWQCTTYHPGANCFDGWFDADRVFPKIPPNEGVRTSASPRVDDDEGIGAAPVYQLQDRATGVVFHFTYGAEVTVQAASGKSQHAWALSTGSHMAIYNIELFVQSQAYPDETLIDAGVLPWTMVGKELLYTVP